MVVFREILLEGKGSQFFLMFLMGTLKKLENSDLNSFKLHQSAIGSCLLILHDIQKNGKQVRSSFIN